MKAVILAGGSGTRGRPYTEFIPKAMIPVCGRPIVGHIVEFLHSSPAISEIIILADLDGQGGQIRNYLEYSPHGISFVQDSQSGTGGDLLALAPNLRGESEFMLWFADNLCSVDIEEMHRHFTATESIACVATRTERREETGFVLVQNGVVTRFVEKPTIRLPMHECLGIYILSTKILKEIRRKAAVAKPINLSFDILEEQADLGRVSAFDLGGNGWIDVESPVILERNKNLVRRIIREMGRPHPSHT